MALKPIDFKFANTRATGKGYFDLPVFKDDNQFVSCWALNFWQRLRILFSGKIWIMLEHSKQPKEMKEQFFSGKAYHQPIIVLDHCPIQKGT